MAAAGVPEKQQRMRVNQLWRWLYIRGVTSFDADDRRVEGAARRGSQELYTLDRPEIVTEQVSVDGTRKWLLRLPQTRARGARARRSRRVYIPESDRGTLCISSQVGCTLTCTFCHTGTQRLVRNLEAAEIVGQILLARDRIGDWPGASAPRTIGALLPTTRPQDHQRRAHGHGRAALQFRQRARGDGGRLRRRGAVDVEAAHHAVDVGRRAGDRTLGRGGGTMLAISLHAVRDELRDELVPINKKYPIAELLDACRNYPGVSNARRITFEYVMLKGVNDSLADAKALVRLLAGIPAKINLIPFNPWPGTRYECSDWETIERFAEVVNKAGYASPVRTPRGRDILAACGQLELGQREASRARAGGRTRILSSR